MKNILLSLSAASILAACSQSNVDSASSEATKVVEKVTTQNAAEGFHYMPMEKFNQSMAQFVGLETGESFDSAEPKINAVFKAYDGQTAPANIGMEAEIVEGGWKQVLVTQDGVADGTLAGQQLLAIFDDEQKLVTYGMRIKCEGHTSEWQNTPCG